MEYYLLAKPEKCAKKGLMKRGDFGNRDRVAAGRSGNSGLCDL